MTFPSSFSRLRSVAFGIAVSSALLASAASAGSAPATPVVSVFSKTMNGYTRTKLADNTYQPETYAFAAGGRLDGRYSDESVDHLKFTQIAGVIAASLKRQNYLATTDARTAQLLIFVYWGTTMGSWDGSVSNGTTSLGSAFRTMSNVTNLGPGAVGTDGINAQTIMNSAAAGAMDSALNQIAFDNEVRDEINRYNAGILGYDVALNETNFLRPYSATARDILAEVEENRYFVVLKAYDFQRLRNHKGKQELWEARFSISAHGNRFDEQLVNMTRFASQFFGQGLDRLVRRHIREGRVEVGTPVVVPDQAK